MQPISADSDRPSAEERLHWRPLLGGFTGAFFGPGLLLATNSVFLNELRESTDWSLTNLSLAPAVQFLAIGIAGPFVGQASTRFGVKPVFAAGAIAFGSVFVLLSQVSNVWEYIGLNILLGLATTMIGMVPITVMISAWFEARRGTALGITFAGPAIAGVFSPAIGPLIQNVGWRAAYIYLGLGVGVVLFLISIFCVGPPPPGHRKAPVGGAGEAGFDVSRVLKTTTFWKLAIAGLLFQIAFVGVNTHVVPFASDIGLVENPGRALGALLSVGIVGRFGMGMVVDRFGARPVFLATYTLVGISLLCVIFSDHIAMFWLFVVLFGISAGGMITVPTLLIARLFGTKAVGQIVGVNLLVGTVGAFIGPPVAGRIREVTGSYDLAIIGWTIAVALGLLLATQIPNPDRPKTPNGDGP